MCPLLGFQFPWTVSLDVGNLLGFEVYQQVGIWVSLWAHSRPLLLIATANTHKKREHKAAHKPGSAPAGHPTVTAPLRLGTSPNDPPLKPKLVC